MQVKTEEQAGSMAAQVPALPAFSGASRRLRAHQGSANFETGSIAAQTKAEDGGKAGPSREAEGKPKLL